MGPHDRSIHDVKLYQQIPGLSPPRSVVRVELEARAHSGLSRACFLPGEFADCGPQCDRDCVP